MPQYDIQAFLNSISDLDPLEMVWEVRREEAAVQRALSAGRGTKEAGKQYEYKAMKYEQLLRAFVFFLKFGTKPAGISLWDFCLFRPIAERLVARGQLESSILDLFE